MSYRPDTIWVMTELNLLELIERLGGLLRSDHRDAGSQVGLQPVHLEVLSYLHRCNRYSNTPAAVTSYIGATKGTLSQSLQVLERQGYLVKKPDPQDGRVVRLFTTRKGRDLLTSAADPVDWLVAIDAQTSADLRTARQTLTSVLMRLQVARGRRTFGQCRTCKHFVRESHGRFRCGLTNEPLKARETLAICHEHEPASI